jgi:hypothetical protein
MRRVAELHLTTQLTSHMQMMIPVEVANQRGEQYEPFKVDTGVFHTPNGLSMHVLDTNQISSSRPDAFSVVCMSD